MKVRFVTLGCKLNFAESSALGKELLLRGHQRASLNEVPDVCAVFENTAGQGSNLGYKFEQLAAMIEMVGIPERTGVCIDTCHAFAAGYDLSTAESFDKCFEEFDRLIGMKFLRGSYA